MLTKIIPYLVAILVIVLGTVVGGPFGFILAIVLVSYIANGHKAKKVDAWYVEVPNSPQKPSRHTKVPKKYFDAYRAYLKTPEWYALRKLVLFRDTHRCVRCGYIGNLQVHHTHYEGIETMSFTVDQLESICKECHTDVHRGVLPMKKDN